MPCTKHNYLVTDVDEIPDVIREAFHLAATGRPGPVLVDIPKDVLVGDDDVAPPRRDQPARLQALGQGTPQPGEGGGGR